MNIEKLEEIKKKAIDDHIPIIMDDTLELLSNKIKINSLNSILEIGTAVRIFCNMLF